MIMYGEMAYEVKFLQVLKELYKEGTYGVRFGEIETDRFEVDGLKQGCFLSLVLLTLYKPE